jgi:hypothetical protein
MINSIRMRLAARVANMVGRGGMHTDCWWEDLKERGQLEDLDVDGRIMLKWIFEKWFGEAWIELIWLAIGTESRSM